MERGGGAQVPIKFQFESIKTAMYFGPEWGSVATRTEARELGERLFALVRGAVRRRAPGAAHHDAVARAEVASLAFPTEGQWDAEARDVFDELFPEGVENLTEPDFSEALYKVFAERRYLAATISGAGSITGVVKRLIAGVWVFARARRGRSRAALSDSRRRRGRGRRPAAPTQVAAVATFLIWNGDLVSAFLLLGSIFVALSGLRAEANFTVPEARAGPERMYVLQPRGTCLHGISTLQPRRRCDPSAKVPLKFEVGSPAGPGPSALLPLNSLVASHSFC